MIRFNGHGQGYFYFAEFEKSGTTSTTNKIAVAKHLSDEDYQLFMTTYSSHMRSMGTEMQRKYSTNNIKKVVVRVPGKLIEVHFKNGDWWHYESGRWY